MIQNDIPACNIPYNTSSQPIILPIIPMEKNEKVMQKSGVGRQITKCMLCEYSVAARWA
jgi:hypothetical protein